MDGPDHGQLSGTAPDLTYTPGPDHNGPDSFTFKANDGARDSNEATVSITVANVAPTATLSNDGPVDEGSPVTVSFSNRSDVPADENAGFHYEYRCDGSAFTSNPDYASASTEDTEECTFDDEGTHTVRARIIDKDNGASEYTTDVVVDNVAPSVTAPSGQGADEGVSGNFDLGSFTDPGADGPWSVTVDWGDGSTDTTFTAASPGSLGQKPHAYVAEGAYTVTVTVTEDGTGAPSDSETFAVTAANAPPSVTKPADQQAGEGTSKDFDLGSFADGGADGPWQVSVDWGDNSTDTTFEAASPGSLGQRPHTYADNGSYTVTVTVAEAGAGTPPSGSATFDVVVDNVAPSVDAGADATVDEGAAFTGSGLFTDPGTGDTHTATVDYGDGSGAQPLTLNANKTFDLSHAYGDEGNYAVEVTVEDDDGDPDTDSLTVTVLNAAPTANGQSVTTDEGVAKSITLTGDDVAADTLTFRVNSLPQHGKLYEGELYEGDSTDAADEIKTTDLPYTLGGNKVTYEPNSPTFFGNDGFDFTTCDDANPPECDADEATVAITVQQINEPPTATNDDRSVEEDDVLTFAASELTGNDLPGANEDLQILTVTAVDATAGTHGTVDLAGGQITYEPDADFFGPASFEYTVEDNGQTNGLADPQSDKGTVNVTVTEKNDAPTANEDPAQNVTYSVPEDSTTALSVTVADGVLANDTKGPNESGQTLTLSDNDANAAGVQPESGPDHGTLALNPDSSFEYTPTEPNFNGTDAFTYEVCDDGTTDGQDDPLCDTATATITVTAVNDPPNAVDDTGATDEDTTLNASAPGVLANDNDPDSGDTKTVNKLNGSTTLTGTASDGAAVTINANGSYTYNPGDIHQGLSTGQTATATFTYTMKDSANAESTATVTITIEGVSDAPVAKADSFNGIGNTGLFVGTNKPSGDAGKEITGSVLSNDTDPDTPQASLVAEPVTDQPTTQGGKITIESDGNFTYHPDDGDTGIDDTFTYRVCDASPCNSSTVTNSTGTLTIPLSGQVWYVKNNSAAGGDGTSDGPFDTIAEGETASSTGDTVYVFDGDNTTTGLATGYTMESNERLLGEVNGLTLDPDGGGSQPTFTLHGGTTGAYPTLTDNSADVVQLASGGEVRGFNIDPSGTVGGISGGSGTNGGTIDNVNVIDTGTAGTQPGLELNGTSGPFNISNLTVNNSAATGTTSGSIGVLLNNNTGTVNFASTGTISITTKGAKGLDAANTSMGTGSVLDDITVTGSGTGGVSMSSTTGTTALGDGNGTDLALTTTSGSTPAFSLSDAGAVTVGAGGTDNVSATGGPAIDVTGTSGPTLDLDDVALTNSSTAGGASGDGINFDGLGTGTFSATGGDIKGAAGISFDLNGGSGNVTYPGGIGDPGAGTNDGSGNAAEIANRTGGSVTLSGSIDDGNDAGGGISMSSNTDGTFNFSGSTKKLDTGSSAAFSSTGSNPSVNFTNGGLDIDTTSGTGFSATGGGTVTVQTGTNPNTIDTTTGTALKVENTTIGSDDLTFKSISANGATNGIRLNNTGTAGNLNITGAGTNDSGGTIQNTSADAVSLTATDNFIADEMNIQNPARDGFGGTNVTNFTVTDSTIHNAGQSDVDITDSAFAFNTTSSANENNIDGNVTITGNTITNPYGGGVDIFNHSGTISDLNVSNNTMTSGTGVGALPGTGDADSVEDAIQVVTFGGTGFAANLTKATVSNNNITGFPDGTGIEFLGGSQGTTQGFMGTPGSSTNKVVILSNLIRGHSSGTPMGQNGIVADVEGRGGGHVEITNNGTAGTPIANVLGSAILAGNAGDADAEFEITGNFADLDTSIAGSSGIGIGTDKDTIANGSELAGPDIDVNVSNNTVTDSAGAAIRVLHRDSNGTINLKVQNNTARSRANSGFSGININNGSSGLDAYDPTMCSVITGNVGEGGTNNFGDKLAGIELYKRAGAADNNGTYTFGIQGLSPNPATAAQVESYLTPLNSAASAASLVRR